MPTAGRRGSGAGSEAQSLSRAHADEIRFVAPAGQAPSENIPDPGPIAQCISLLGISQLNRSGGRQTPETSLIAKFLLEKGAGFLSFPFGTFSSPRPEALGL